MDKQKYVRNVLEFDDVREMLECEREMAEQSGYERGMQQGMQKGREEALFQIAKNFLELGIPLADVAKATGLSEEEIIQRT
jgi:predicted transposase/invertase (TIGR01784 family)